MRTIYYKVAVSPEEEQFFLIAMELLMFKCKKDYEESKDIYSMSAYVYV